MSDEELRLNAMQLAIRAFQDTAFDDGDIMKLAKQIYKFIKGETK